MTTLADFDSVNDADVSLAGITPELYASLLPAWLPNGFYTVTLADGSHRTFRVRLEQNGVFKGRRTIALLIGPENTTDYEAVGFVERDGFNLWKRHRNATVARHANILWRLAKGEAIDGHELRLSKRCLICNRPLTTPESHERGIGPECAKKAGVA